MQFDDSKSGDHLETGPDEPPAVVANIPERQGVTGVAANFVLHVNDLMNGKARLARVPEGKQRQHEPCTCEAG